VGGNNRYLRPAVLIVICLLHGILIVILVRTKTPRRTLEPASTIYLIIPALKNTSPAHSENALAPHLLRTESPRFLRPELSSPSTAATSPLSVEAPPIVNWLAEAQRSAADIADREQSDRTAAAPSSPTGSPPWDPHTHLLESTGHGLKLRIPVVIPTEIIDHCFIELGQTNLDESNLDHPNLEQPNLSQTPSRPQQRLQIGCALRKQPARGDLFDSLRKGQPKE
jgi:hypothetical protein